MFMNGQHQGHKSRWVICVSMFASKGLAPGRTCAIPFCLNCAFMLFFGGFKNYDANINLIIQGELTACQCLLLFITLDETGN